MSSLNVFAAVGNLTREPELTVAKEDLDVCEIGIALNHRDGKASFLTCTAFRKTAQFINKYFKKGEPIGLSGYIKQDNWQDQDGKWQHKTRIMINEAFFVAPKQAKDTEEIPF